MTVFALLNLYFLLFQIITGLHRAEWMEITVHSFTVTFSYW